MVVESGNGRASSGRPKAGARKRCSDPLEKGCKQFARRNTVPAVCVGCGGGTRAATRHTVDPDTGATKSVARGLVSIPPRVQQLLDGTLPIEDLDEEELARGYPRAVDGSFRCPPNVVPRALHTRMVRELFDRSARHLKVNLVQAVENMTEIANNKELDAKVRLQASQWIVERLMGKTPDVQVNVEEKRYERMFNAMDRTIVDAEVIDDGREP